MMISPALPSSGSMGLPVDAIDDDDDDEELFSAPAQTRRNPGGIGDSPVHRLSGSSATFIRAPPADVPGTPLTSGLYGSHQQRPLDGPYADAQHNVLSATLQHLKGKSQSTSRLPLPVLASPPSPPTSCSSPPSSLGGLGTPTASNLRERRLLAHRRGSSVGSANSSGRGSAPPVSLHVRTDVARPPPSKPVRPPRSERRNSVSTSTSDAQATSRPTNRPRLSQMETPGNSAKTLSIGDKGRTVEQPPTWEAKVRAWSSTTAGLAQHPPAQPEPRHPRNGSEGQQQSLRELRRPREGSLGRATPPSRPGTAPSVLPDPPADYMQRPFVWAGKREHSGESVEDLADPSLLYAAHQRLGAKPSSGSLHLLSPPSTRSRSRAGSIAGSETSQPQPQPHQHQRGGWSDYAHSNHSAVSHLQASNGGSRATHPALAAPSQCATPSPSATSSSNFSSSGSPPDLVRQGLALTEEDVEVIETRSVEQHSSLFGIRRRLVSAYPELGASAFRSALRRRSSSMANGDDSAHHRPGWTRMDSERSLRKAEEKLEAREAELSLEAVSKHEAASVTITVWTEQREGRWTTRGPAPPGAGIANRLPDIGDVWLIPINARAIVERKKLRSNIELATTRTVVVCNECAPARARGLDMMHCRLCKGAGCVEKVFVATVTIRVATFLPLKMPALHLMGARQPHLTYLDSEDAELLLRERAVESTLQACRRVGQQHSLQHDAQLLMAKAKIERRGVLTVSVQASRRKRVFEVGDHVGKITEVTASVPPPSSSSSSASRLKSASTTSLGGSSSTKKSSFESSSSGGVFGRRPSHASQASQASYSSHTMPRMKRQGSMNYTGAGAGASSMYSRGANPSTSSAASVSTSAQTATRAGSTRSLSMMMGGGLSRPKLKSFNSENGHGNGNDDGDSDIFGSGGTFGTRTREPSPTESPAIGNGGGGEAAPVAAAAAEGKKGRLRSLFRSKK